MSRILVVDDKPENLYLLRVVLRAQGWEVDEAANGAQALEAARRVSPDLIVSDLLMPVMDGYTLLRHCKADPALRGVPFVVYTATYTEPADERLALQLGAAVFIVKPAEPEVLAARIGEVLAAARSGALPAPALPAAPNDEQVLLEAYSQALVHKLEDKMSQLEAANRELRARNRELMRFERSVVDRELRMVELKKEVDELRRRLGEPPRYFGGERGTGGAAG